MQSEITTQANKVSVDTTVISTDTANEAASVLETDFGKEQPIEHVPYSRLRISPLNARTKPLTGIEGLAANIAAKGLLQNLVVHLIKGSRSNQPKLGVCAGQRRLAALDLLYKDGRIPADYPVPVRIVSEGEAFAVSLIENSQREALDVFDLIASFKRLANEGKRIDYIAALFSVSPLTVKRRLKLADVSPKLLALLREDDAITLDQLAALALVENHETQEQLWFDAPNEWQRAPHYLRQAITRAEIDASRSRLVKFVGLDAYEAAGGYVRRDLFSDELNAGYVADAELVQRLVSEKLDAAAEEVRAEGFSWVETRIERDYGELNSFGKLEPVQRAYTDDEQRELDALSAQRDGLAAQFGALEEGDEDAYAEAERLETALDAASDAIDCFAKRAELWDVQHIAEAGAFVMVGPNGELMIERGLVRPESKTALQEHGAIVSGLADTNDTSNATGSEAPKERPIHSATLCQRLTAHRTAAVQAELTKRPSVALAVLLRRLVPIALPKRYGQGVDANSVQLNGTCTHEKLTSAADDMPASVAWGIIDAQSQQWAATLPVRRADLLPWLIQQDPGTTLLDLLAFCTASLVDGISGTEKPHAINAISNVLELDMTRYWTATRASYFDHVSKARITEVVTSAISPKAAADLQKMKKGDAAAAAELHLAKVSWLPDILTGQALPTVNCFDPENEDEDRDESDVSADDAENGDTGGDAPEGHDARDDADGVNGPDGTDDTDPSAANTIGGNGESVPAVVAATPAWPFPTAASAEAQQRMR